MKASKEQVQIHSKLDPTISESEGRYAVRSLGSTVHGTVDMAGRDATRRAAAGRLPRLVLPGHRSVFVRESEWQSGTGLRIPSGETAALMRLLRSRDLCILLTLAQHHYLTTDLLQALFFPSIRAAQLRLQWLTTSRRLLMRWRQLEPRDHGWRRRHSLYMLAERGAVVLARAIKETVQPIVKRSWYAAEYALQLAHDLDVNAFFVSLAAASRELPDQGLYHWVGQDSLRREYQDEGTELAPDGWGRFLMPAGEVLFSLEWDLGTESSKRLTEKARSYVSYFSARPGGDLNHVLFVGTGPVRERTIRSAISRARASNRSLSFATTHMGLLQEQGPLGGLWLSLDGSQRMRLTELDSIRPTGRLVADCVGKLGWWERRPGAGEGA